MVPTANDAAYPASIGVCVGKQPGLAHDAPGSGAVPTSSRPASAGTFGRASPEVGDEQDAGRAIGEVVGGEVGAGGGEVGEERRGLRWRGAGPARRVVRRGSATPSASIALTMRASESASAARAAASEAESGPAGGCLPGRRRGARWRGVRGRRPGCAGCGTGAAAQGGGEADPPRGREDAAGDWEVRTGRDNGSGVQYRHQATASIRTHRAGTGLAGVIEPVPACRPAYRTGLQAAASQCRPPARQFSKKRTGLQNSVRMAGSRWRISRRPGKCRRVRTSA